MDTAGTEQVVPSALEELRERQRAEIAAAAILLVSTKPPSDINVTEIVKVAGMSRKTFYKYFTDVGDAMLFTHRRVITEMTERVNRGVADIGSGLERLLERLRVFAEIASESPELIRFVTYVDYTLRGTLMSDADRLAFSQEFEKGTVVVQDFIIGQQDGSIRDDLRAGLVLPVLGRAISGLIQRYFAAEHRGALEGIAAVECELEVWRGYLMPNSAPTLQQA